MATAPPRAPRRLPTLGVAAAVGVAAALASALGSPAAVTFPWSALGHARAAWWEALASAGVLLLLLTLRRAPRDRASRALAVAGLLLLGVTVLPPTKYEVNRVVTASAAAVAMPFLGVDSTRPMRWTRATVSGNGVTRATEIVADEWLLMALAGGVHQEADITAVATGALDPGRAARTHLVRRALWRVHQTVVLVVSYGRTALVLLSPWVAWAVWKDRAPWPLGVGVAGLAWAMPAANALSVGVVASGALPDDRALWVSAAGTALVQLGVVALATRAGRA